MTVQTTAVLAVLALVGLVTGCGDSTSSEPVATTSVTMAKSYRFDPPVIEVDRGSTVVWTNEDNFTHRVQVEGGEDYEAAPGETVSITFDQAGTFEYVCTLHRLDMDGEVIVR